MCLEKIKKIEYWIIYIITALIIASYIINIHIYIPFIRKNYFIRWIFASLFYISIIVFFIITIDIIISVCSKKYTRCKVCEYFLKNDFIVLSLINCVLKFLKEIGTVNILLKIFNIAFNFIMKILSRKTRLDKSQNEQDMSILLILIVLSFVLRFFQCWGDSSIFSCIVVFFVVWRLIDILSYQLSIIFTAKENRVTGSSFPRTIALFLVNVFEIILIYSILYLTFGAIAYNCTKTPIDKPLEALYFSITTISTTGFGEMLPVIGNGFAKFLVLSEISVGILLLVIFFGVIISRWKSKDDRFYQILRKAHRKQKKIYRTSKYKD